MNKIFKTKYDVTTGQTKVVSELASNRQLASSSEKTLKCGGISGSFLGLFKLLPLAFLLTGSFVYGQEINIVLSGLTANESKIGPSEILNDSSGSGKNTTPFINEVGDKSILLAPGSKSFIYKKNKPWSNNTREKIDINTNNWMRITESVVIGHRARASAKKSVAVGEQAFAALNSTSLGSEAIAYGNETVALGMQSYAEQTDDVALGHLAYAKGSQSTALGAHSSVESQKAVAIGYRAKVDHQHTDAIALGAESEADSPSSGSFMITKDNKTEAKEKTWISEDFAKQFEGKLGGVLSIGKKDTKYRQIVNVAPGTEDTHAVNLGQLREAMKNAGGGGVSYFSVNKLTAMQNKDNMGAKADHSLAIGVAETEMGKGMYSIVIGTADDTATGSSGNTSTTTQEVTKASGKAAVVIGSVAKVEADYGIALGKKATVATSAIGAIAIGKDAETKAAGAVVLGHEAKVESAAGDSIALGKGSKATKKETAPSEAKSSKDVKFAWTAGIGDDKSVVSIGDSGKERQIKHVAAGVVTSTSTDAINGSQLYAVADEFSKLAVDVLGAEKADKGQAGFKKSTFSKVEYQGNTNVAKTTFRDAINETITAINKGLKFTGNTGGDKQLQLGDKLTIQGKKDTANGNHKNITTEAKDSGILEVALNEDVKEINSITGKATAGNNKVSSSIKFNDKGVNGTNANTNVVIDSNEAKYVFERTGLYLNQRQIKGVQSGLNKTHNGSTETVENILAGADSYDKNIAENAVNVKDLSMVAKAILDKELKFKGDNNKDASIKLSETLEIKGEASYTQTEAKDKTITVKLTQGVKNKLGEIVVEDGKLALGKGSKTVDKTTALDGAEITVGQNSLKFDWKEAGTSADPTDGNKKSVISVGDTSKERLIKHVAAGEVTPTSTDAVNGGQLYSVIEEFGKLGVNVLGAEVDSTDKKFKPTTFPKLNAKDGNNTNVAAPETFKAAINANIAKLNEGIKFGDGTKTEQFYLGSTLNIKAEDINTDYKETNLKTEIVKGQDGTATLKIGLKASPTFTKVMLDNDTAPTDDKELTNKKYVDDKLKNAVEATVNKGISFEGNGGDTDKVARKLGETLKIVGKGDKAKDITVADNNIKVSKNTGGDGLEIGLSDTLTGIKSVANDENAKIALGGENGKDKTITFTSGDKPETVTLKGSTLSGVSEIKKAEGKGALKLDNATATLESAKNNSKLELKENEATLSAGENKGSIKVTNGTDNKIELSPENGSTVMLKKDATNGGVQATGLSTIGKNDSNALVFKDGNTAELKVGGNALTFTKATSGDKVKISKVAEGEITTSSTDAINGKQLADLVGKLGVSVNDSKTGFSAPSFTQVKGGSKNSTTSTYKDAIDDLITAVNKGLSFKGNDNNKTTMQLGGTLTIDSSESKVKVGDTVDTKQKDITVAVEPNSNGSLTDAGKLTLQLNKADKVDENDERLVTSKAVADELKKYTPTAKLETDFLKVTGENIGKDEASKPAGRKTFGSNVGIAEIKLTPDGEKSSTELVQAKAVIDYLKGTGTGSVKISDNPETKAEGEGSIAVGDKAIAQNAGAVAIGQNAGAKNAGAISIGKDSDVTSIDGVALGRKNVVGGQSSIAIGETNTVSGVQSYVIGSDNTIAGRNVIAIGSKITTDDKIYDAVILGNGSTGEANTVSVGNENTKRRIINVADPTKDHDAANKKYVDERGLKFKGNEADQTEQLVNLDKLLTIDSSEANKDDKGTKEKDIKTKVEKDGDGAKLTLTLNKADKVSEHDERAVSSKAVHQAIGEVKDSLANAIISYKANDEKDAKTVKLTEGFVFKNGDNTTAVVEDKGVVKFNLNKELKNMTSFETEADKQGNKSKLDQSGLTVTQTTNDGDKVQTKVGKDGTTIQELDKDGKPKPNGKSASYTLDKAELKDGDKSNTSTAEKEVLTAKDDKGNTVENTQTAKGNDLVKKSNNEKELASNKQTAEDITLSKDNGDGKEASQNKINADGMTVGTDKSNTHYGKDGMTVNGKDGAQSVFLGNKGEGENKTPTLEFAKDGEKGTGAIRGLKDLDEKSTGDMAVNKNYVDNQLSSALEEVAGNRPFDYYLNDIKVSKDKDGKFYKENNGQKVELSAEEKAQIVIKAEPQSTPMTVSNIKAAKLATDSTDAVNGAQLVAATGALAGQDGKMTFADGRDGKAATDPTAAANQGLTAKDGLNGHNANDKANALRNGEAGSVVYTDSAGQRLVKANDGKYYHAADVENNGVPKDGKSAVENPQLSLVNTGGETDKPVVLGNVASGLGIDADKAKEHAENVKKAGEAVKTEAQAVAKKVDDMLTLQTAKEAKQDAIDALETALSFMPETTPEEKAAKEKAKAKIEGEKSTLADINSKLDKAKKEVESAQGILKTKQDAYQTALKAKDGAVNKLLSGDASVDVHRGANLQDLQALGQAGLNFEGNDGVPVHKNLGEKLTIKGEGEFNSATTAAGNIKVDASETGLEVKLSDTLKNMTSFETKETVEGNKSRLDGNGLRVTHKDGKSAHYGSDGVKLTDGKHGTTLTSSGLTLTNPQGQRIEIDGEKGEIRVPDLTPNSSPNTVVNKGYVDSLHSQTAHKLETTDKNLRAGIAGANAAAGLAVTSMPGTSMLSVSTATYDGQNAVAVGYSKMSDNGKIMLRLQGNSNSRGKTAGSVSVGYLW